ncbi:MAG: hypothetical protein IZT59_08620 [Verrucomicrobia bacterium]|nr:hypothetical protein [Verrucomicrobiota bacterium]
MGTEIQESSEFRYCLDSDLSPEGGAAFTTSRGVLAPHKAGTPGVNLHCAIHSYRIGKPSEKVEKFGAPHSQWFEYLGLQSSGHGLKKPMRLAIELISRR